MRRLIEAARGGSIRAASRLISCLEDEPSLAAELFAGPDEWPQPRLVVGLTGPSGVGKSSLIDGLIGVWRRRQPDALVGVLAVDPSSPFTGGALLGDRIRMMRHATDGKVFIRSLANRGHLGGLTLGIRGALRVMGLVGCKVVLIETVGVGQGEVEVAGVADLTVVVLAPSHGDGVQLLKAGLIEAGDLFVVNKADQPGADRLLAELTATLQMADAVRQGPARLHEVPCGHPFMHLQAVGRAALLPPVFRVRATEPGDVDHLADGIEQEARRRSPELLAQRQATLRVQVRQAILEAIRVQVAQALASNPALEQKISEVLAGRAHVRQVAAALLQAVAEAPPSTVAVALPPGASDGP
jgi:LAO/AO transport system kinase